MDVKTFKSKIETAESNISFIEGVDIGLIQLNSRAEFEPCQVIAASKQGYHFLDKEGRYDLYPKRTYQIVCRDSLVKKSLNNYKKHRDMYARSRPE